MRITSGEFSGIRLIEVKDKRTRISLDRVRESLFNSLRGAIEDKIFWDLFAGSGAVGIEAISMGAKFVVFVEKRLDAINVIRKNLSIVKVDKEKFKVFKMDV
ncbi:MAG: RsmD family RNA methyltransferase, partial [Caldisericia bacterium]|nr:RsmD family RNA methyltransferase [Caldisericia bacterium]